MEKLRRSGWENQPSFTVLDLDFGDAECLLTTIAALLSDARAPQRLHYVAVIPQLPDPATVSRGAAKIAIAIDRAAAPFQQCAAQLNAAWPIAVDGFHRLILADGRLILTLVVDAIADGLPQLDLAFDLVCCNVADTTPANTRWLGRLAANHALLILRADAAQATSAMQAGLAQIGFIATTSTANVLAFRFTSPQLRAAATHAAHGAAAITTATAAAVEKHAIVIGAGIAGAAACHSLTRRGWRCTLVEQQTAPAQLASGNPAGIYMPALSKDDNPLSRLSRSAYLFALRVWDGLGGIGHAFPGQACGLLQLARSDAAEKTATPSATYPAAHPYTSYPPVFVRWMNSAEASATSGQTIAGGWWFAAAGWVHPPAVCRALLDACGDGLRQRYQCEVATLSHDLAAGIWNVLDAAEHTIASAPVVILANGAQATTLAQTAHLPLISIRGQITSLPDTAIDLPFALCGDAYLTPVMPATAGTRARHGHATLGATYDRDADPALRANSHQENIDHLQQMLPDWTPPSSMAEGAALGGRVGFRCVAPDRLPLVGALPDPAQLAGSGDTRLRDMPRLPGLYGLLAYGSRGLIWAPLMAELLAAQLNGEPPPLPRDLCALVDPARFALKQRRVLPGTVDPRVE